MQDLQLGTQKVCSPFFQWNPSNPCTKTCGHTPRDGRGREQETPTSRQNAHWKWPGWLLCWNLHCAKAQILGCLGDMDLGSCDSRGVGWEDPFCVWKKQFSQKCCICNVSAPLASRAWKLFSKLCIWQGLPKIKTLESRGPHMLHIHYFFENVFFNSKMGMLIQRPMNRNYKGRGFKIHCK